MTTAENNISTQELSDESVEKFYAYGFAQYNSGHWNEAIDVFRILCTRRPFEPKFWFGLGAAMQEMGSYSDALSCWAMVALLKPEDPHPHFHAAECYFSLQDSREGAKALAAAEHHIARPHILEEKIALLKEQWRL